MTRETSQMTPDEILFTNVFNKHRPVLTAFAKCATRDELHIVRDGFYLALASELCSAEYEIVRQQIIQDAAVAFTSSSTSSDSLTITVKSARKSGSAWDQMIQALKNKALQVGSDLDAIWNTLETGRLEWLTAASGAHALKKTLKSALDLQCGGPSERDAMDAKMIWIYALSLNIPSLKPKREAWQRVVQMKNPMKPLVEFEQELWDPRKEEWRPLDVGVQGAAERGGSSIDEAWKL